MWKYLSSLGSTLISLRLHLLEYGWDLVDQVEFSRPTRCLISDQFEGYFIRWKKNFIRWLIFRHRQSSRFSSGERLPRGGPALGRLKMSLIRFFCSLRLDFVIFVTRWKVSLRQLFRIFANLFYFVFCGLLFLLWIFFKTPTILKGRSFRFTTTFCGKTSWHRGLRQILRFEIKIAARGLWQILRFEITFPQRVVVNLKRAPFWTIFAF